MNAPPPGLWGTGDLEAGPPRRTAPPVIVSLPDPPIAFLTKTKASPKDIGAAFVSQSGIRFSAPSRWSFCETRTSTHLLPYALQHVSTLSLT